MLDLSLWNLIAIPVYVMGVLVTHLRLRNWWITLGAALVAWTVDGQLVPLGAVIAGMVALLFALSLIHI